MVTSELERPRPDAGGPGSLSSVNNDVSDTDVARAVVEALADHEDAIGDLYDAYGAVFGAQAGFWQGLSAEEYGHGSLMRDLAGPARTRDHDLDVFVDTGRFPLPELRAATRDVRDQIELVGSGAVSLVQALQTALGFEDEMIERESYQVFDGDADTVAAVLNHLRVSSERHRDRLRDMLQRETR